jgi:CubicO group peptidase (beta-lactamase class C family)
MDSAGQPSRNTPGTHSKSAGHKAIANADSLLNEMSETGRIPGMAVGIHRNGEELLQQGYGYANLEKRLVADPEITLFRIASISKPIAATALLNMVADGLINLDTSFYHYVPYFPRKQYDFTIRQLAGHTAGIRGYRGKEYGLNKPMGIRESLAIFQDDPLLFEPGTAFHYNSFGWVLISLAIQEVSGMAFSSYVSQKVLQPLGLLHTTAEKEAPVQAQKATFYTPSAHGFRIAIPVDNTYKLAGGGYLSTVADIAMLGRAYLEGRIGPPELTGEFLSPGSAGSKPTCYGLGWEVSEDAVGRRYYGHSGNSVGACTRFQVYPEHGMVFVFLINSTNPGVADELAQITRAVLSAVEAGTV